MRMPFGKHKGEDIRELPDEYIVWLFSKKEEWKPMLCAAVEAEFERRYAPQRVQGGSLDLDPELVPVAKKLLNKGWRVLLAKLHPDQPRNRDDPEARRKFDQVNRVHEVLVEAVEDVERRARRVEPQPQAEPGQT